MSTIDAAEGAVLRHLARFILLSSAGQAHLRNLLTAHFALAARKRFVVEDGPSDAFFVVLSGWAIEYRQLRDGRRQIVNFRLPGEVVGIESLLYGVSLHSAATLTPSRVAKITRASFDDLQRHFPRLASGFLLTRIADSAILREWAVSLGRRSAFDRIAHLLLELDARYRKIYPDHSGKVALPLTQLDIADSTALTGPYVNRILGTMRRRNLLASGSACVRILDTEALADAAGFCGKYLEWTRRTKWQAELPASFVAATLSVAAAATANGSLPSSRPFPVEQSIPD